MCMEGEVFILTRKKFTVGVLDLCATLYIMNHNPNLYFLNLGITVVVFYLHFKDVIGCNNPSYSAKFEDLTDF